MNQNQAFSIVDLEQKGMITILINLIEYSEADPANITILRQKTGLHNETIESKLEVLKIMGLVKERKQRVVPCTRHVWLTEKGQKLAAILQTADAALKQP